MWTDFRNSFTGESRLNSYLPTMIIHIPLTALHALRCEIPKFKITAEPPELLHLPSKQFVLLET